MSPRGRWLSGGEVVDLLAAWKREAVEERQRLAESRRQGEERKRTVALEQHAAWANLLTLMVPSLDAGALDAAAARMGLAAVGSAQVLARRQERWRALTTRVATIEADRRFVARESQLNAIDIRMAELDELRAPLRASVDPLDSDPVFAELLAVDYGLATYRGRFWQLSYYHHWKHGDRIVEEHGPRFGVADFAGVRRRYWEETQALRTLDAEAAELQGRAAAIHRLVEEHGAAQSGLADLDAWSLASARQSVREHLDALGDEALLPLFAHDESLALAAKRVSGSGAKGRYLDSMANEWLGEAAADLDRRVDKLERGIQKFGRPKNLNRQFERAEIEAKYAPPREAWAKRRERYDQVSRDIVVYQDYGSTPMSDFLWWDFMTHHHHHHLREVDTWRDEHHDVGQAVAASWAHRQGGDSLLSQDAS